MPILLTAFCSLLAAIAGAFIVPWLTRSREHAIWVRDSRIREWQELLGSLTTAHMTLLTDTTVVHNNVMIEDRTKQHDALADVDIVLATRIFIADDVSALDVRMRWAACVTDYKRSHNKPAFNDRFNGLRIKIVEKAKQTK